MSSLREVFGEWVELRNATMDWTDEHDPSNSRRQLEC